MKKWVCENERVKMKGWESERVKVGEWKWLREWESEIERLREIKWDMRVLVRVCNRVKERETVRVRISKHNQIYASANQIYDIIDEYVWASIQIIVVRRSNPTWASFLYKLLKTFTRFWIPQGLLAKRVKVKKWKRIRVRVQAREFEGERVRVR